MRCCSGAMRVFEVLTFLVVFTSTLEARFDDMTFDEFRSMTPCATIVRVIDTGDIETRTVAIHGDIEFRFVAHMKVEEVLTSSCGGLRPGTEVDFLYSGEVHSAQPGIGEEAVVFPMKIGEVYVEAVYGRSYWPIETTDGTRYVRAHPGTAFLLSTLKDEEERCGYVKLAAVRSLWSDDPRGTSGGN